MINIYPTTNLDGINATSVFYELINENYCCPHTTI
jgi:hypothetical protein